MMKIRVATVTDIPSITKLAEEIWWPTYTEVISNEQIAFMLQEMYSAEALKHQMENGHHFLVLEVDGEDKGFASYSLQENKTYKLQKLYLHPDQQGKGAGKFLITEVEEKVKSHSGEVLILNVNRGNKAKIFYEKMGYQILEELDIPYHHFVLNDYIMGKNLD
jgi:diamine N-acetyltransferase